MLRNLFASLLSFIHLYILSHQMNLNIISIEFFVLVKNICKFVWYFLMLGSSLQYLTLQVNFLSFFDGCRLLAYATNYFEQCVELEKCFHFVPNNCEFCVYVASFIYIFPILKRDTRFHTFFMNQEYVRTKRKVQWLGLSIKHVLSVSKFPISSEIFLAKKNFSSKGKFP